MGNFASATSKQKPHAQRKNIIKTKVHNRTPKTAISTSLRSNTHQKRDIRITRTEVLTKINVTKAKYPPKPRYQIISTAGLKSTLKSRYHHNYPKPAISTSPRPNTHQNRDISTTKTKIT